MTIKEWCDIKRWLYATRGLGQTTILDATADTFDCEILVRAHLDKAVFNSQRNVLAVGDLPRNAGRKPAPGILDNSLVLAMVNDYLALYDRVRELETKMGMK